MIEISPSLFVADTCQLGEGPFWWESRLWWVDVDAGRLHSVDGAGKNRKTFSLGQRLGAAAPVQGGGFVVAVEEGIGFFDLISGWLSIRHRPEYGIEGSRFNDGKCDPAGRFLAGTLSMTGQKKSSALYSLDRNGYLEKIHSPVTLSNGLAWSSDGQTLYHIDTPTQAITAFFYDVQTGRLGKPKTVVHVPEELGWPDGMCIDQNGNLWVAHWGGSAVRCWNPSTGECLAQISTPCSQPTSCCFGGSDLASLFITSARLSDDVAKYPEAGSIFVCRPGVSGYAAVPFAGQPVI